MSTPRALRLNADDNVVMAVDRDSSRRCRPRGYGGRARAARPQDGERRRSRTGAPVRKFGQIIGFAAKPDRARRMGARAQCRHARFRARLSLRRSRAEGGHCCPRSSAPLSRAIRAPERQDRHAKLHRRSDFGELLGLGRTFIAQAVERSGILERLSHDRRRHRARPWHRLRLARRARASRCSNAPNGATPRNPKCRGRRDGRARLRGVPDRPHEGRLRSRRERHLPDP